MRDNDPMVPELDPGQDFTIYSYDYVRDMTDKIYYSTGDDNLRKELLTLKLKDPANKDLAGDIDIELSIQDSSINEKIDAMLIEHLSVVESRSIASIVTRSPFDNTPTWINYMKPHEFNPVHKHAGIVSFVWYLDVPEEIREEYTQVKSNLARRGCIEFYSSLLPRHNMTFNPKTNDFFMFNALHEHQVYPYYSDNTRISLAGNIYEVYYEE